MANTSKLSPRGLKFHQYHLKNRQNSLCPRSEHFIMCSYRSPDASSYITRDYYLALVSIYGGAGSYSATRRFLLHFTWRGLWARGFNMWFQWQQPEISLLQAWNFTTDILIFGKIHDVLIQNTLLCAHIWRLMCPHSEHVHIALSQWYNCLFRHRIYTKVYPIVFYMVWPLSTVQLYGVSMATPWNIAHTGLKFHHRHRNIWQNSWCPHSEHFVVCSYMTPYVSSYRTLVYWLIDPIKPLKPRSLPVHMSYN